MSGARRARPSIQALVVEDDPSLLRLLDAVLRAAGVHVVAARSADEAWTCLGKEGDLPDVVIVDQGQTLAQALRFVQCLRQRQALAALPVVVLANSVHPLDLVGARLVGADEVLAKPFSPRELQRTVRRLAGDSSAGAPPSRRIA